MMLVSSICITFSSRLESVYRTTFARVNTVNTVHGCVFCLIRTSVFECNRLNAIQQHVCVGLSHGIVGCGRF